MHRLSWHECLNAHVWNFIKIAYEKQLGKKSLVKIVICVKIEFKIRLFFLDFYFIFILLVC